MINVSKTGIVTMVAASALLWSCVPMKTFKDLEKTSQTLTSRNAQLERENRELSVNVKELNTQNSALTNEVGLLVSDTIRLSRELRDLSYNYNETKKKYDDLQLAYETAKSGSSKETEQLLKQLQQLQNDLQAREDALNSTQQALNEKRANLESAVRELSEAQKAIEARNAQLLEMERMLGQKDSVMNALQSRVLEALKSYEGKGLKVHMKDGLLYVSMDEKLLFKSGRWDVDPVGVAAIQKIAEVLAENPDIRVTIEGHTDDVPYNGSGQVTDNWDLSTKRATSIVRILLANRKITPSRVTAAGRGEFVPLDNAKTAEARQKNRRTEIILMPNLDELMRAIGGQ